MIAIGSVIRFKNGKDDYFICHIDHNTDLCATRSMSDLENSKYRKPMKRELLSVINEIKSRNADICEFPYPNLLQKSDVYLVQNNKENWIKKRDFKLAVLGDLISEESIIEYLYGDGISDKIQARIEEIADDPAIPLKKKWKHPNSFYRSINQFIGLLCTRNALIPFKYSNCGSNYAHSSERNPGVQKRGRKGKFPSAGVTVENIENLKKVIATYGVSQSKFAFHNVITDYQNTYEVRKKIMPDGSEVDVPFETWERLSLGSLQYHIKKLISDNKLKVLVHGNTAFTRDFGKKLGTSIEGVTGATYRFEIDATILDVYLKSELRPNDVSAGRPTLVFIVDVYSTMVVGYALAFSSPNGTLTAQALLNTFIDKVEFAKKFHKQLDPDDWPAHHFCHELTADNGKEISKGLVKSMLTASLGIKTLNLVAARRGDFKGTVENKFKLLNDKVIHQQPGSVYPNRAKEESHSSNYAVLTFNQINSHIIDFIIEYNKTSDRSSRQSYSDIIQDNGISPQEVYLSSLDRDLLGGRDARDKPKADLLWALMPAEAARIDRHGVHFKGIRYIPTTNDLNKIFDSVPHNKSLKIEVKHSRDSVKTIWFKREDGKLVELLMAENEASYRLPDMSEDEMRMLLHSTNQKKWELERSKLETRVDLKNKSSTEIHQSRRKSKKKSKSMSPGIKANQEMHQEQLDLEWQQTLKEHFSSTEEQEESTLFTAEDIDMMIYGE